LLVPEIRRLATTQADFDTQLAALTAFETAQDDRVDQVVAAILADVRQRGDAAVLEYTARFDALSVTNMAALELAPQEMRAALASLTREDRSAL
jgi:histidinol dehydrogenase